ncbi:hypothetical protein ACIPEN_22095 [Herbaspirillum chlorophenolicum]|uniref:Uncharacterized protein n=1 Tax=Herbaspirillum chlorophenolicum TaxID=211589 RepID=A0ABW8F5F4_9BURK
MSTKFFDKLSEKLTSQQNNEITKALCAMTVNGVSPEKLKEARRALVDEVESINKETQERSLSRLHNV